MNIKSLTAGVFIVTLLLCTLFLVAQAESVTIQYSAPEITITSTFPPTSTPNKPHTATPVNFDYLPLIIGLYQTHLATPPTTNTPPGPSPTPTIPLTSTPNKPIKDK